MIPQIQEVNFPSYATLHQAVVSLSEMGDRVITTQVRIDGDIVPEFDGWELRFKGERFILPIREPQAAKDNTTRNSLVDLTFYSWPIYEMKRFFFVEMASTSSGTAIANRYVAPLALNIESFVDAFNNVLNYYFGNKIRMDLFMKGQGIYNTDPAYVEIDYTYIWDVLTKVYETYDVRWVLEYDSTNDVHVIKVGYPADAIEDHDFEYGYQGGLVRFERQVQEENITNILLGRGGENNLPYRYFKRIDAENPEWAADPDAIPELQNIYFDRLLDINFRRYVQGWKTNPNRDLTSWDGLVVETYDSERGEEDFAYAKGHTDERFNPVEYVKDDYSILKYGEHWGALDDNDEIYPTIQGVDRDGIGRVDEVVDVSEILTDDIQAAAVNAATEYDVMGVKTTLTCEPSSTYEIDIRGEYFDVPEGKTANFDKVGAWVESFSTGKVNGTTVFSNTKTKNVPEDDAVRALIRVDSGEVRVFDRTTGERVASNVGLLPGYYYYELHLIIKSDFTSSVFPDAWASVNFTVGTTGMRLTMSDQDSNAWKPTFDIWVKNIWDTTQGANETDDQYAERVWRPILGDHFGKEASIAFSDGFMSISEDYEFIIASYPVPDRTKTRNGVTSEWKITLYKSDAEFDVTGFYIPNSQSGGQPIAGDHFYFLGIDMPHFYVKWAEERLNGYKQETLNGMAEISPTWIIQLDKVRVHTLEQEEYGATLAERLATGATIRTKDKRFTNNAVLVLYVQSITYTWNEPSEGNPYLVPDIEVVLSNKPAAMEGTIDRMQSDISVIRSTYARTADLESAIRKTAGAIFLKKTGESDSSASPTTFSSKVSSTNFRQGDVSGQGWGFYLDNTKPASEPPAPQSRALRAPAVRAASEEAETETPQEGKSVLELDKLIVREELRVNSLVANQISYEGGKQIISAASIECTRVIDTDEGYVCYFDQKQGSVANLFVVNDIAFGQVFDPENSEDKYYKRVVTEVGDDYIVLSKTDYDGDGAPEAGDTIIQYGNKTISSRQYVIIRDVIGGGYERMLSGLSTVYSTGTEYYFAGRQSGSSERWFVGNAQGQYAEYQNGVLNISGRLAVTSQVAKGDGTYVGLSNYLNDLQNQIDGNIQTWYQEGVPTLQNYPASSWDTVATKNNHIGDLYYNKLTGKGYRFMLDNDTYVWVQLTDEEFTAALAAISQLQTDVAGLNYLKLATNSGTLVQGGLVLTSLIQLGNTESGVYRVYAGINGIRDANERGGGIAAWYGGPMADIEADSTLQNYAKTLFRFDGSGYLASGNISWNPDGTGSIPGISWSNGRVILDSDIYISGGNEQVTSLVNAVNAFADLFELVNLGTEQSPSYAVHVKNNRPLYADSWISAGGRSTTSGGGGGGSDVTVLRAWPANLNDENEALGSNLGKAMYDSISALDGRVTRLEQAASPVSWGSEPTPPGTTVELNVNGTSKTLLKANAIEYEDKAVGIITETDFYDTLNTFFPLPS